jgi:hypothetical protein
MVPCVSRFWLAAKPRRCLVSASGLMKKMTGRFFQWQMPLLTDSAVLSLPRQRVQWGAGRTLTTGHDKGDKSRSALDWRSTQTEPPCQCLKSSPDYFPRFLAELTVKFRVVMRIHAMLERFGIGRAIKEPRRDTQCTDPVTGSPSFVSLAIHLSSPARRTRELPAL